MVTMKIVVLALRLLLHCAEGVPSRLSLFMSLNWADIFLTCRDQNNTVAASAVPFFLTDQETCHFADDEF